MKKQNKKGSRERFGIAEWYGHPFGSLTTQQRLEFAEIQFMVKADRPRLPCPFQSWAGREVACTKEGGVCSIRKYELLQDANVPPSVHSADSLIRTTCPYRFQEAGEIYRWIGQVILGTEQAVPIGQVPFLNPVPQMGSKGGEDLEGKEVGRIDNILAVPDTRPLQWCAVEIQAVYFSGDKMRKDFESIKNDVGPAIPFPAGKRRPDYRSSGPKRLLPQLQIKVPTLRTWGKKMAVVVDESFFAALGQMKSEDDLSNAEVVWFIVRYEDAETKPRLARSQVFLTRLEDAQTGLVAAKPVTLHQFEKRILSRLSSV